MAVGSPRLAVGNWPSAVGGWQSAIGSRQSAVGSWQPAVGSRQLIINSTPMIQSMSIILILTALIYGLAVYLLGRNLKKTCPGKNKELFSVAVVMAARNEEENIADALDTLLDQTYDNYTIYVVDDRSTDRTTEIVSEYQKRSSRIHLIRIDHVPAGFASKKFALHTAIRQSSQDLIVTTDADCRVSQRWLERIVSYFEAEVGMVIGLIHYTPKYDTFLQRWQSFDFFALMCATAATTQMGLPFAGAGPSLAYRREVYNRIGGYGSLAHRTSGDDVLLIALVLQKTTVEFRFMPDKDAVVYTDTKTTWSDFYRQRQRWASNSGIQWRLNKRFFVFLALVFWVDMLIIICPLISFWQPELLVFWLLLMATKLILEYRLLSIGAKKFDRTDLKSFFVKWFVSHPFYVFIMGFAGSFGKIRWK
ncbi:MAG: glycosyltransferase [Planctomycetes bacterium]|nr:glycosyltransferase [Planctomycetota bacterium]